MMLRLDLMINNSNRLFLKRYKLLMRAKGDWDFRISDLVKKSNGTDI